MAARLFVQRHFEELQPPSCLFRNIYSRQPACRLQAPMQVILLAHPASRTLHGRHGIVANPKQLCAIRRPPSRAFVPLATRALWRKIQQGMYLNGWKRDQ